MPFRSLCWCWLQSNCMSSLAWNLLTSLLHSKATQIWGNFPICQRRIKFVLQGIGSKFSLHWCLYCREIVILEIQLDPPSSRFHKWKKISKMEQFQIHLSTVISFAELPPNPGSSPNIVNLDYSRWWGGSGLIDAARKLRKLVKMYQNRPAGLTWKQCAVKHGIPETSLSKWMY